MRISDAAFYTRFLSGLSAQSVKTDKLLQSLADGKRVRVASDDPGGAQQSLGLRSRLAAIVGFDRSAETARTDLATLDGVLGEAVNLISKVQTEALAGASSTQEAAKDVRADVIDSIREQLIALANTTQGGRYLFGGTQTLKAPFASDGTYLGNNDETEAPIDSKEQVGSTLAGRAVFQIPQDLFALLDDLSQALRTGTNDDIGALIPALDQALDQLGLARAEVGTRLERIDRTLERHGDEALSLTTRIAEIEDIDLAQAIVGLQQAETTTSALSAAAARTLGRSLFDFLG